MIITNVYFFIVLAVASNALAGILLKLFNDRGGQLTNILSLDTILYVGGALFLYFLAFIFYTIMLKYMPLGKSYAILTFSVQIVLMFVGVIFFKEKINFIGFIGLCCVFLGIILIGRGVKI